MTTTKKVAHSKFCNECKNTLPLTDFHRHGNGYKSSCKSCRRKSGAEYYQQNRERRAAQIRDYGKQPHRKKANIEKMQRLRSKYPHKYKARQTLNNAIAGGKVIRPDNCSHCGLHCAAQGHHTDYSKPLDVMWLCSRCHAAQHKKERDLINLKEAA